MYQVLIGHGGAVATDLTSLVYAVKTSPADTIRSLR